jgi:hypothetical protein
MSESAPLAKPFDHGRGTGGKFAQGNQAALGTLHPHAIEASRRSAEKRRIFSGKDQKKALVVVRKILEDTNSRPGDLLRAAELVLAYRHGKPVNTDENLMVEVEMLAVQLRMKINGDSKQ